MTIAAPLTIENKLDDTLPKRRDLPTRAAGQDLLVREPDNGGIHFLNATAAVVWNCCDGATSIQDCAAQLRETFAVPADADLVADIREIAADLAGRGLFESKEVASDCG